MRIASLVAVVLVAPACQIYFDNDDDNDRCDLVGAPEPALRLVNPETLACQTFSQPTCDEECGPCAQGAIYVPPWGECSSSCVGLSESACIANSACRVARGRDDYYGNLDDYMGCYPLGTQPAPDVERCEGLDAEQCSLQADCSALYDGAPGQCTALTPEQCAGARFRECIPESEVNAGTCDQAACRAEPPSCPTGTKPGVYNGCWSGACIPTALCTYTGS